mgnify:CR=1 FL=1
MKKIVLLVDVFIAIFVLPLVWLALTMLFTMLTDGCRPGDCFTGKFIATPGLLLIQFSTVNFYIILLLNVLNTFFHKNFYIRKFFRFMYLMTRVACLYLIPLLIAYWLYIGVIQYIFSKFFAI